MGTRGLKNKQLRHNYETITSIMCLSVDFDLAVVINILINFVIFDIFLLFRHRAGSCWMKKDTKQTDLITLLILSSGKKKT